MNGFESALWCNVTAAEGTLDKAIVLTRGQGRLPVELRVEHTW